MVVGSIAVTVAAGCGDKEGPAPAQDPPQVVKVSDLPAPPVKGARYDSAALLVQISFTEGGKGRARGAVQTHVSVVDDKLFFARTPHRRPGERINKSVSLSAEDKQRITQMIRDNALMSVETIRLAKQPDTDHRYASASIKIRVDGAENEYAVAGVTELDGAATAFSQTAAYRAVSKFVADIEAIARRE